MEGWIERWMEEYNNGWIQIQINGCKIHGWMDGQTDGWKEMNWMDESIDGWVDRNIGGNGLLARETYVTLDRKKQ